MRNRCAEVKPDLGGDRLSEEGSRIAAGANSRHIEPSKNGGWDATKPGATRASAHADTQAQAQARARTILGNDGGGEMITHGRNGQIRAKDTIEPGNDPRNIPG